MREICIAVIEFDSEQQYDQGVSSVDWNYIDDRVNGSTSPASLRQSKGLADECVDWRFNIKLHS